MATARFCEILLVEREERTDNHKVSEPFENLHFLKADPMKKTKNCGTYKNRADIRKEHLGNKLTLNKVKQLAHSLQKNNLTMFGEILRKKQVPP